MRPLFSIQSAASLPHGWHNGRTRTMGQGPPCRQVRAELTPNSGWNNKREQPRDYCRQLRSPPAGNRARCSLVCRSHAKAGVRFIDLNTLAFATGLSNCCRSPKQEKENTVQGASQVEVAALTTTPNIQFRGGATPLMGRGDGSVFSLVARVQCAIIPHSVILCKDTYDFRVPH